MSSLALRQLPGSAVALMGSALAAVGVLILWSLWLRTDVDLSSLTSWSDVSWQIAQVDARGRIVRIGSHPFALAVGCGLVSVCLLGAASAAWFLITGRDYKPKEDLGALARNLEKVGQELDDEVLTIVRLVQEHADHSGSHTESLSRANQHLASLTSPEQIRKIVQFLIAENIKVQNDVAILSTRLQQSQSQVEKLRASLTESQRLGMLDAVTLLKNRHWLEANLPHEVDLATAGNEPLSIIMADVDNFKRINDTYGHAVGDEVLRLFAELLSKNIKGRDTAVRYGGEEFVVMLPQTRIDGAHRLGEQLRSELEAKRWMHHKTGRTIGTVTASFGIAELRVPEKAEALIERADERLYEAKSAGRNRVISET